MNNNNEVERLKALRDRQLEARDPLANQRKVQRQVSMKYKQHVKKRNIIRDIWDPVSYKWKGLVFGSGFGMLIFFIVNPLFSDKITVLIAALFIPVLMFIGIIFGASFDWRDNLIDF
jgi:hypothetical protein